MFFGVFLFGLTISLGLALLANQALPGVWQSLGLTPGDLRSFDPLSQYNTPLEQIARDEALKLGVGGAVLPALIEELLKALALVLLVIFLRGSSTACRMASSTARWPGWVSPSARRPTTSRAASATPPACPWPSSLPPGSSFLASMGMFCSPRSPALGSAWPGRHAGGQRRLPHRLAFCCWLSWPMWCRTSSCWASPAKSRFSWASAGPR